MRTQNGVHGNVAAVCGLGWHVDYTLSTNLYFAVIAITVHLLSRRQRKDIKRRLLINSEANAVFSSSSESGGSGVSSRGTCSYGVTDCTEVTELWSSTVLSNEIPPMDETLKI